MHQRGGSMRPRLLAAMLLTPLLACNGSGEVPPNADTYRIEGYVRDARDGTPLSAASVRFRSDALDEASAETDSDGRFVMEVVTHHPFGTVRAEKEGYQPAEADVYFDASIRRLDLSLQPAAGEE